MRKHDASHESDSITPIHADVTCGKETETRYPGKSLEWLVNQVAQSRRYNGRRPAEKLKIIMAMINFLKTRLFAGSVQLASC
jgi:hypothetical protein